jgi:hypothetical protein
MVVGIRELMLGDIFAAFHYESPGVKISAPALCFLFG